jgi:hypothetical protein
MNRRSRALEKEVAWVVAHPARARAWSESGKITTVAMVATLALGLVVHVVGFAIGSGSVRVPGWLPVDLAATLVSNLGIVLWTSVVLVFFLDILPSRIRRRATTSMALAAKTLEDQGLIVPDELADVAVDVQPRMSESDPTLQAVLDRLTAIERRLAETEGSGTRLVREDEQRG